MLSPASQHREAILSQRQAVVQKSGETDQQGQLSQMMRIRLDDDKRRLSAIRSQQKRNAAKRALIPKYADYLQVVLNRSEQRTDNVFSTLCIWCMDSGDYHRALPLIEHALAHNLPAPAGFDRSLLEISTEVLADTVLTANNAPDCLGVLERFYTLAQGRDMYDLIAAKLNKVLAMACEQHQPERALQLYEKALALYPRIGVKRAINRLRKTKGEST